MKNADNDNHKDINEWFQAWKRVHDPVDWGFIIAFAAGATFALAVIDSAWKYLVTPAHGAEQWEETNGWFEQPDDMVCTVMIDGTEVLFTYRSGFKPEVLPVEGMLCKKRNYEKEAKEFQDNNKLFDQMFPTGSSGYDTPPGAKVVLPIPKEKPPLKKEDQLIPLRCLLASHPPKDCPNQPKEE